MRIIPRARLRDGRAVFEPGREYEVDDQTGARFVAAGWVTSPDHTIPAAAAASAATIRPDTVTHHGAAGNPKGA